MLIATHAMNDMGEFSIISLTRFNVGAAFNIRSNPIWLLSVLLATTTSVAGRALADDKLAGSPFVVVFIDSKTEKMLGPFPYDRAVLAQGIDKAVASGAKGVILKFFIDQPKTADGDRALAEAARHTKLILQSRIDDSEAKPNPLLDRFALHAPIAGDLLSGKSGWLPLADLSATANDLGFIDVRVNDRVPIVERYRGTLVKSLFLASLEFAFDERADVVPAKSIRLHGKTIDLDSRSEIAVEYPTKDDLSSISFSDFLAQPARPELKDRIVILGYDSDRFESVETPAGKLRPHRAFVYALMSLYRRFL